jgi:hypothetical protein
VFHVKLFRRIKPTREEQQGVAEGKERDHNCQTSLVLVEENKIDNQVALDDQEQGLAPGAVHNVMRKEMQA